MKKPCYHVIEILFRIGAVAFLSGIDVYDTFKVFDREAHYGLVMSLEHRQVHYKVALEDIGIEKFCP